MRAFVALELPEQFIDEVAAVARCLSEQVEGRFLSRDTYHITLAFLGEIDSGEAALASDAIDAACASFPLVGDEIDVVRSSSMFVGDAGLGRGDAAFDEMKVGGADALTVPLRSDGLGKFGRPHDATLWMGIAPDPALVELASRVREELSARGLSFDTKPFKPHLTLARRVRLPRGPLPPLAFPQPDRARALTLFKSTLTREGAIYKPLYSVELG